MDEWLILKIAGELQRQRASYASSLSEDEWLKNAFECIRQSLAGVSIWSRYSFGFALLAVRRR